MAKRPTKRIYVRREIDQNDTTSSWLVADETPDSIEDGETVYIYELVETKKMTVTRKLL